MIRRYLLPLLLLLPLLSSTAHADTYPAASSWHSAYAAGTCNGFATPDESCTCGAAAKTAATGVQWVATGFTYNNATSGVCTGTRAGTVWGSGVDGATATYVCKYGGTLSGSSCVNATPCTAPQVRDATTGQCVAPPSPCASKAGQSSYGWITIQIGGASPYGSKCAGGCSQYVTGPVSGPDNPNGDYYTNGKTRTEYAKWQFDGSSCSTGDDSPAPSPQPPRTPPKEPPCAAGEGVMTSSSGKINCVPPGTPESTPPVVKKETEKKTNPDNTTAETTTTTTRDPLTGVEQKSSSTTTCSGTNCTTSSTTSTSGTGTNGNGTPDGTGNSDFCQKNPTLDICTGKLAKEETLGKIKDALDPKEAADKSKLDAAKQDFDDKQKAHKDFIDAFAAKAQSDEGGLLKWAMIPEVPAGSCVPFTGTVMGRVVTFDFCDSMAKVRDIAGYGFYLMTMFALFAIFASSTTSGGKS